MHATCWHNLMGSESALPEWSLTGNVPLLQGGVTFLSMEDETGLMNVICSAGLWKRYRAILTQSTALVVRGLVDSAEGAVSIVADKIEPLDVGWAMPSRDFR